MIDSTRPVAPYLAPEITAGILDFIPLELRDSSKVNELYRNFAVLGRIGQAWKREVQQKLVTILYLTSVVKLRKLIDQFPLEILQHVTSLLVSEFKFIPDYYSLLFAIFQSTKNLKHLQIDSLPSSFAFDNDEISQMRSNTIRARLNSLKIAVTEANILDLFLILAPNIETLTIVTAKDYKPHEGEIFTSDLNNLKELSLTGECGEEILQGRLWKLIEFEGLRTLKKYHSGSSDSTVLPFFKIIGLRLLGAKLLPLHCTQNILSTLTAVGRLQLSQLSEDTQISIFPITNSELAVFCVMDWPNFAPSTWKSLKVLTIDDLINSMDISTLPPLETIRIKVTSAEIILESLKNLEVGKLTFENLIVGRRDVFSIQENPSIDVPEMKSDVEN